MHPVGVVYDSFDEQVQLQILRDLILLSSQWDLAVYDPEHKLKPGFLDEAGIEITGEAPKLYLVYKVGDNWPEIPEGVQRVDRDLQPHPQDTVLDSNPKIGYYLKEQGRNGANLTQRYLSRSAPRGTGLSNVLVQFLWG